MNEIQIRVPKDLAGRLRAELARPGPREPVVFALVRNAKVGGRELVLVRQLLIPPETAYLPSEGHGARWTGAYTIQLLNLAAQSHCGLFVFHAHGDGPARMSLDDSRSALQLLPKFQLVASRRPHGSIVLASRSAAGLILMPGDAVPTGNFSYRTFGARMITWPPPDESPRERRRFLCQPLARGALATKILAQSKVAIVGQSGGGTHVAQQLLQFGLGEILGIDDDYVDEGNRFAGIGIGEKDIQKRRLKVDVVRRNLARIVPSTKYTRISERLPHRKALEAIKRADAIVGCVNNLHARADIQEIALRYMIPYVDVGLTVATEDDRKEEFPSIQAISGNVFTFSPGGACLWCAEFLTDEKLATETEGRGRPYLITPDNLDAFVLSFNGVLASQAVTEVLQVLIGFAPEEALSVYKKYDGLTGKLCPWIVKKNPDCPKCKSLLGAGDPIWKRLGTTSRRSAPSSVCDRVPPVGDRNG